MCRWNVTESFYLNNLRLWVYSASSSKSWMKATKLKLIQIRLKYSRYGGGVCYRNRVQATEEMVRLPLKEQVQEWIYS